VSADYTELPPDLPVPEDDGGADHLPGLAVPSLSLPSTAGSDLDPAQIATRRLVVYFYPRTGTPGEPLPQGWDEIPGARGCTPQSCAYRDSLAALDALGATVIGVSTQSAGEQMAFAAREQIPFPLLSDPELRFAAALSLPTFTAAGMDLYKRLTLVAEGGLIIKTFYPVFPPDRDAAGVLGWLREKHGDS
jgi:peroxiredoxin